MLSAVTFVKKVDVAELVQSTASSEKDLSGWESPKFIHKLQLTRVVMISQQAEQVNHQCAVDVGIRVLRNHRFCLVTSRLFLRETRRLTWRHRFINETAVRTFCGDCLRETAFAAPEKDWVLRFKFRRRLEIDFRNRGTITDFASDHIMIVAAVWITRMKGWLEWGCG